MAVRPGSWLLLADLTAQSHLHLDLTSNALAG